MLSHLLVLLIWPKHGNPNIMATPLGNWVNFTLNIIKHSKDPRSLVRLAFTSLMVDNILLQMFIYIHLATPHSIILEDSTGGRTWKMARPHRRVEHTGWIWFKEFTVFVYHYVLSYFKPNQVYKDRKWCTTSSTHSFILSPMIVVLEHPWSEYTTCWGSHVLVDL